MVTESTRRVNEAVRKLLPWLERRPKPWIEDQSEFWYRVFEFVFTPIFRYWIRFFRAIGAENVPATGGVFVLCNHTSGMDPFILGYALPHRRINGPGKVELFKNPVFGFLMRKIGIFPLHRDSLDAAAVRTMVSLYRAGRLVVIYPEGTRSETGDLLPFLPGVTRLLIKLEAQIVPAGVAGGNELLPIHARIPRRNTPVVAAFGSPFDLSRFYSRRPTPEMLDEATKLIHQRVEEQLATAREERARLLALANR
jgi:1-acyl-sn-glycerol-3-phosphate acyltransferase